VTQGTSAFDPDVPGPPPDPGAGEPVDQPDIKKLGEALRDRVEIRSLSITGLFVLAAFYTLYFARAFFLPIILAVLLDFLLSPLIRTLKRARIPEPLGAALVIIALLGTAGTAVYGLVGPAKEWAAKLPSSMREAEDRLRALRTPVEQVSKTAEQVEEATKMDNNTKTPEVVVKGPRLTERLFGTTQTLAASFIEVIILLYFLLAAGDLFLQKLIKVLPQLRDKKKAVAIARETEASISTYLLTVTLVNIGLGLSVAGVMFLLGMPNPLLWGALAALVEFVPYLGATALVALLTGRSGDVQSGRACAAGAGLVSGCEHPAVPVPLPLDPRPPADLESSRYLRWPGVLVVDLGRTRRFHRRAAHRHLQDFL